MTGSGKNLDSDHKIDYNFDLFIKDSLKQKIISSTPLPRKLSDKIPRTFHWQSLFSDLQGYITGPFEMSGPFDELNFTAKQGYMMQD